MDIRGDSGGRIFSGSFVKKIRDSGNDFFSQSIKVKQYANYLIMSTVRNLSNQLNGKNWKTPLANYSCAVRPTAAIMVSKIEGFNQLLARNHTAGMFLLSKSIKLQEYYFNLYQCTRVVKMGDTLLVGFSSPTQAVSCALKIATTTRKILGHELSISLHLGEVRYVDNDFFGSQVNVAFDIHKQAKPGQILTSDFLAATLEQNQYQFGLIKTDRDHQYRVLEVKSIPGKDIFEADWGSHATNRILQSVSYDSDETTVGYGS